MSTRMKKTAFELYAEHLLAPTQEQYNDFRQEDMIRMTSGPTSPPLDPATPMTTFTGHRKGSIASESQVAINSFKKGTKRDASDIPSSRMISTMTHFQRSFLATLKEQGFDPDFDPDDGGQYEIQLFLEKQSSVYSVLIASLQTDKGRELV